MSIIIHNTSQVIYSPGVTATLALGALRLVTHALEKILWGKDS